MTPMSSSDRKQATGAGLAVGGLATVKGATEYQHRAKIARTSAHDSVTAATAALGRQSAAADAAKGKAGALIRDPRGNTTKRRLTPEMQRDAAQNLRHGVARAKVRAAALDRVTPKRVRGAQRTKVGGLAAMVGGTYLGVKGLRQKSAERGLRA